MTNRLGQMIKSSRDIILRTNRWAEAVQFYEPPWVSKLSIALIPWSVSTPERSFCTLRKALSTAQFLTTDVQAAKERLVAAGCSIVEENPNTPRCYVKDPFGLVFNLGTKDSGV